MNCAEVNHLLPLYLSGELRGQELADVQLHLQECQRCAQTVYEDREQDNLLRAAMLEETPDVSAVLRRVHEGMAAPRWRRMLRPVSLAVAGLAAAIVVAALAGLPRLLVHQAERNMALEAAKDHYSDLVLLRHPDWERTPDEVARFMQKQFPQKQSLLSSITPDGASLEKVRLCNLGGTTYAHFVFRTGTAETSVFLRADPEGRTPYQAAHLRDGGHGLEVAGFSSSGLTGMVVGPDSTVPAREIAHRLAQTL